jgi:hypothetical protein
MLLRHSTFNIPFFTPQNQTSHPCLKNNKGQLCMDENAPYAEVPGANKAPIPLQQVPEPLKDKLPIEIVTYPQLLEQEKNPPKNQKPINTRSP